MDFSRLECREILAHLSSNTVDPDVLAKLQQGAAQTGAPPPVKQLHNTDIPQAGPNVITPPMPDDPDLAGMPADYLFRGLADPRIQEANTKIRAFNETTTGPKQAEWTEEDVACVNEQKISTWKANRKANRRPINMNQTDAANADFAPPDLPPGYGIDRVPKGQRGRNGDLCIDVTPEGLSIFQCAKGHGYVGNNPTMPGCPTCFTTGGSTASVAVEEEEEELSGMDTRW